jgi:hypothetical protein
LTLGLVLRHAIALLQATAEFRAFALDHVEIVIGEFAPLLLNLAFERFPITDPNSCLRSCCRVSGKTQRENKSSDARRSPLRIKKCTRAVSKKDGGVADLCRLRP